MTIPIEIETGGQEDSLGDRGPGTVYSTFAFVEPMTELVAGETGETVLARHRVWIEAAAVMAPGAIVRLFDGTFEAIKGGLFYDMDGIPSHQEWTVGDA